MKKLVFVLVAAVLIAVMVMVIKQHRIIGVVLGQRITSEDLDERLQPPSRAFAALVEKAFIADMLKTIDVDTSSENIRRYLEQHSPELLDAKSWQQAAVETNTIADALEDVAVNETDIADAYRTYKLAKYFTPQDWESMVETGANAASVNAMRKSATRSLEENISDTVSSVEDLYRMDMIRQGICDTAVVLQPAAPDEEEKSPGEKAHDCYVLSNVYIRNYLADNVAVNRKDFKDYWRHLTILVPLPD